MGSSARLDAVADIVMGQSPPGSTYNEEGRGLPFFQGVADFGDRTPNPRVYCNAPSRIAQPGDILISVRAPIGRVNVAREQCSVGRGVAIVRVRDASDERFLELVLRSLESNWSRLEGGGTVFGNATRKDLEELNIAWPTAADRRAIAAVLGALDDKIESNRRIWALRKELAIAEYLRLRSSVADFLNLGALYEQGLSGVWGEDAESESSSVRTVCLRGRDLEDFVAGAQSVAPTRFISHRQYASRKSVAGEIWTAGSGSLGPTLLITDAVLAHWGAPLTYSNFVKRLVPIGRHGLEAVAFLAVMGAWKQGDFANFRTGTAMPNLDVEGLLRGVEVPRLHAADAAIVSDLVDLALHPGLLDENATLAALRDALLPELLSGRMRVRDAEAIAEELA